jgi:hypothetical protein
VERVLVALLAGQLGRGRGDVEVELLLALRDRGHRQRGRGGGHVEDGVRLLAVVELLRLGVGDVRLVLVVGGDHLDVGGDRVAAMARLEVLDGHLDRLDTVPAGQVGVDA